MRLSIVIPTLNEERYLPILLQQLKKQTMQDFEVIIADGGSSDNTLEIARSFGCKIVKGGTPAKGRNEGAKVAKAEILLFMDADNIYLAEDFIERLLKKFEERRLDLASFPIYPNGNWFDKLAYFLYNLWTNITQNFLPHATNSLLIKKSIFEKTGGFDEDVLIAEDHELARRAGKIGKFGFIADVDPMITSARRFEIEGRFITYGKYILAGIYMLLFGPIKRKIFEYRFDHLKNKKGEVKYEMMEEEKKTLGGSSLNRRESFLIILVLIEGVIIGLMLGVFFDFSKKIGYQKIAEWFSTKQNPPPSPQKYAPQVTEEEKIIEVAKKASNAVVSIVITKDVPLLELYYESPFEGFEEFFGVPFEFKVPQYRERGKEKKEVGWGTGFFVTSDGLLLTNAHVVSDKDAQYTVFTNDGKKYSAKVVARDTIKDLAIIKVEGGPFSVLPLGDSNNLEIGQTVVAIGNALGEFRNTVSVGVISGLGRRVTASGGGIIETIEDVIQTDAAINSGNSGGPLLNLKGEVIGINFAMAQGAENIGFAIPINQAKKAIDQVKTKGKIVYPFLGVRYLLINEEIQRRYNLPVSEGALVIKGDKEESAIFPGSMAEQIGIREGDIILEFNGEKITQENSLAKIITKYNPGDEVTLKILRGKEEKILSGKLGERTAE